MLHALGPQAPDNIIALIAAHAADPRADKLDLGVGVYRDAAGRTPVMAAVKAAEERLWRAQDTKTYKALIGDAGFIAAMCSLVLADCVPEARVAGAQAPGGTGALHLLFELVAKADGGATVWLPDPSWPNHAAMLAHLRIPVRSYRYVDPATGTLDTAGMVADLAAAGPRDVVLLHGCCHNPTGVDLGADDWVRIADMAVGQGFTPLIDFAYQGFGDGLADDAAGVRAMAARVPELLIAASCSKTFGLYRDRVGAALVVSGHAGLARDTLTMLNRVNYSFPPDHGAAVAAMVLTDPGLRAQWMAELDAMRLRMVALRAGLADALRRAANDNRFDMLARHRGMFSRLPATPAQVERLRTEHGIYMVGDGRINVAGLSERGLDALARAIVEVGV